MDKGPKANLLGFSSNVCFPISEGTKQFSKVVVPFYILKSRVVLELKVFYWCPSFEF